MKTLLLATLALLTLTGCVSSSTAKALKVIANDPATVSVRVNGWGTVIEINRANPVIGMSSAIATDGSLKVTTESVKGVPGTVAAAPQRSPAQAAVAPAPAVTVLCPCPATAPRAAVAPAQASRAVAPARSLAPRPTAPYITPARSRPPATPAPTPVK
jgi:hypothetical protein